MPFIPSAVAAKCGAAAAATAANRAPAAGPFCYCFAVGRWDDVVRVLPPPTEVKKRQLVELDNTKAQQVGTCSYLSSTHRLLQRIACRCTALQCVL